MIVEFKFFDLSTTQIPERSEVGYLIGVEASLVISDHGFVILNEPTFPVLELAWSLGHWTASSPLHDFEFESLDYEEIGVVSIRSHNNKWVVSSCFNPTVSSAPYEREVIFTSIANFIGRLYHELKQTESDAATMLESAFKLL